MENLLMVENLWISSPKTATGCEQSLSFPGLKYARERKEWKSQQQNQIHRTMGDEYHQSFSTFCTSRECFASFSLLVEQLKFWGKQIIKKKNHCRGRTWNQYYPGRREKHVRVWEWMNCIFGFSWRFENGNGLNWRGWKSFSSLFRLYFVNKSSNKLVWNPLKFFPHF